MIKARTGLALFQHHDAITGTAKQFVTHDYGVKLFEGIIAARNVQKTASQFLLSKVNIRQGFTKKISILILIN